MALILGGSDVLQIPDVVVAPVAIFVVHLPSMLAWRRAKECTSGHTVNIERLAMHPYNEIARWVSISNGDDTEGVAHSTMGTDLPAFRRLRLQSQGATTERATKSAPPVVTEPHDQTLCCDAWNDLNCMLRFNSGQLMSWPSISALFPLMFVLVQAEL